MVSRHCNVTAFDGWPATASRCWVGNFHFTNHARILRSPLDPPLRQLPLTFTVAGGNAENKCWWQEGSAYFYAKADQLGWRRWEERLELDTGTICAIQSPLDSRTLAPRLRRWRTRGYVTSQPPKLGLRNIWKRTWDDLVSEFRAMLWIQFRHSRLFMILSLLDSKLKTWKYTHCVSLWCCNMLSLLGV